jgi:uncharacterized protein
MEIPLIIKVLASLGVIMLLSKWMKHLHFPVLAGALFLGLTCGHDLQNISSIALERTISKNNLFMITVVIMIIWLSSQMSEAGIMKELVIRVRARVSQRAAMGLLPALIGLLPMPGGALFSAPLVDDCDHDKNIDPLLKTRINYWFRHVWEYWWPLYPGVLLAMEITGIDTVTFMLGLFPLSLVSVAVGWYFLLRPVKTIATEKTGNSNDRKSLIPLLMPIFIIIGIYAIIRMLIPGVADYNKYLPMLMGIAGAILYLQLYRPLPLLTWKKILLSKRVWTLALLVLLVRIYGAYMEADLPGGTSLVETLRTELEFFQIAPILVIILIPFICGMTTGLAIGFVGASFPIVMSMAGTDPSLSELLPIIALAYGCGYLGMLLSPVHVCLIVSNQHFRTKLYESIKHLIPTGIIMFILILAYHFLLRVLLDT